jgi:hypothetical protein
LEGKGASNTGKNKRGTKGPKKKPGGKNEKRARRWRGRGLTGAGRAAETKVVLRSASHLDVFLASVYAKPYTVQQNLGWKARFIIFPVLAASFASVRVLLTTGAGQSSAIFPAAGSSKESALQGQFARIHRQQTLQGRRAIIKARH